MTYRTVKQIVTGMPAQDGAGVKLKRIIGQPALQRLDPFLMLDEFGSDNPNDYLAGFPPHPHRGFQTVTYMLDGSMLHKDSVGNEGKIESGGIQWMNAGRGIIHEEMPQHSKVAMRGFQLWVNLPAAEKMSAPGYQDIPATAVPTVTRGEIAIKVLAGELDGQQGPVSTQSVKPLFLDMNASAAQSTTLQIPSAHNGFVYCYEGNLSIAQTNIEKGQLGVLSEGDDLTIELSPDSRCILVAGQPLNEPVVQYGPFVMNSEEQIRQALKDYQSGALA